MQKVIDKNFEVKALSLKKQTIAAVFAVIAAVVLPQLIHLAGKVFSLGKLPGEVFLPMHLPVILVGFLAGPYAGLIAGVFGPIISSLLSGMPVVNMVPVMALELAGYGLSAGVVSGAKMPAILKVVIVQIFGRLLRAFYILVSIYVFSNSFLSTGMILGSIATGLPGILIQWILLPILYNLKRE